MVNILSCACSLPIFRLAACLILGPTPHFTADALLLIPPANASGLGELGKHGSLISRHFGSSIPATMTLSLFD